MEKLKPKAVIFDLGSTLIEYEKHPWPELMELCMKSSAAYLRKHKYEIPDDDRFIEMLVDIKAGHRKLAQDKHIEWSVPQVLEKLLSRLEIEKDEDLIDKLFDAYYKPVDKSISVYDDSAVMLDKIKNSGYTIGLISNTIFPETAHQKELKRFALDSYFDFTIFSSTFGYRKPHENIFYAAANSAGFAPSECLYIGDRYLEDITGPNSIGMDAILKKVKDREYPSEMPETTKTISNLTDLEEYLFLEEQSASN